MVIPLRTLTYGIPLLLIGLLAALPFRRGSEPATSPAAADPAPAAASRIAPIEELPVSALPPWQTEPTPPPVDPMQSLRAQFAPMAESYQAVAIPLERPAKIADRFSAAARPPTDAAAEQRGQPLVGHPAALASTRRRGQPVPAATSGQFSEGWERGLQKIKEGGKARLIIPSHLAYGKKGKGDVLPYTTLIFEIDLIDVQ